MRDRFLEREADDGEFRCNGGAAAWAVLIVCVLVIVGALGGAAWWTW